MLPQSPSLISVPAQGEQLIGRSSEAVVQLLHSTVSGRHATIERIDDTIVLRDLESKFGTYVNGTRVGRIALRPGDQVRFGREISYRVMSDGLRIIDAAVGIELTCKDLNLWGSQQGSQIILARNITFSVEPNSFVGILGPSGCGKSTLLNVLATYHQEYDGLVRIDDDFDPRDDKERYVKLLGHVPQTDLVYSRLTVRESLAFAAELRGVDSRADVERILELTELKPHAEKLCDKLSGGQRKRLCVGYELLRHPRLLLLDEPTAGLDPATESSLMAHFRLVAAQGTTVVCTTHIMDNVELFDRVVVLGLETGSNSKASSIGTVAFVGPPRELLTHLQCRTYADLYEKLARGQFEISSNTTADVTGPPKQRDHDTDQSRKSSRMAGQQRLNATIDLRRRDQNSLNQIGSLLRRSWAMIVRSHGDNLLRFFQPVALGTLTCLTQFGISKEFHVGFFSVVTAIWLGMNNAAPDIVRERGLYVRETLAGLRRDSYLTAKALQQLAVGSVQLLCLLLTIIVVGRSTFHESTWDHMFDTSVLLLGVPTLLLSYAGGMTVGMLVSTLARSGQSAVYWLPILIMPQLMISAVATGVSDESYRGNSPFRPLLTWSNGPPTDPDQPVAAVADGMSLFLFSRPASILLDSRATTAGWGWIADGLHLATLVLIAALLQYITFCYCETRWQYAHAE